MTFEDKTGKTGKKIMFLTQSDKFFANFYMFYGFFAHFFAQNCNNKIMTAQTNLLLEGLYFQTFRAGEFTF